VISAERGRGRDSRKLRIQPPPSSVADYVRATFSHLAQLCFAPGRRKEEV